MTGALIITASGLGATAVLCVAWLRNLWHRRRQTRGGAARDLIRCANPTPWNLLQILDGIPGMVATRMPDGRAEYVNRQMLEFYGPAIADASDWSAVSSRAPFHALSRADQSKIWL